MDVTIAEAIRCACRFLDAKKNGSHMPAFTVDPSTHG
jgi:hypothetical protein